MCCLSSSTSCQPEKWKKNNVSQIKVTIENMEEATGKDNLDLEFKKEVMEGIDDNIFVVDKGEEHSSYVQSTVNPKYEIKPGDAVEYGEQEAIQTVCSSIAVRTLVTRELEDELVLFHGD